MDAITGTELKRQREDAGIRQWQLGASMGVASTRVSQIEALAIVPAKSAERYLAALQSLQVASTSADADAPPQGEPVGSDREEAVA